MNEDERQWSWGMQSAHGIKFGQTKNQEGNPRKTNTFHRRHRVSDTEVRTVDHSQFIQTTELKRPLMLLKHNYHNLNSRKKFQPASVFEPRTSRSLAWHSTT